MKVRCHKIGSINFFKTYCREIFYQLNSVSFNVFTGRFGNGFTRDLNAYIDSYLITKYGEPKVDCYADYPEDYMSILTNKDIRKLSNGLNWRNKKKKGKKC